MSLLDSETEKELVRSFKEGEQDAFAKVVRLFLPSIFRQARIMLGLSQDAEDACQEVFLKAYSSRSSLRNELLLPWLSQIAHFHCIDLLRKRKRRPATQGDASLDLVPHNDPPVFELPEYLSDFSETERQVLILRSIDQLSYKEISKVTNLSEGSLRNMFSKVIGILRRRLEQNDLP